MVEGRTIVLYNCAPPGDWSVRAEICRSLRIKTFLYLHEKYDFVCQDVTTETK